jgi:flagellar assembly protein FliH
VLRGAESDRIESVVLGVELGRRATQAVGGRQKDRWRDQATASATAGVRDSARSEGYAQGYAEGRRAAAAEAAKAETARAAAQAELDQARTAQFHRSLAALDTAVTSLEAQAGREAARAEHALAEAAFPLVETMLGRELELATTPGADAVRRALALAPSGRPVTVRLNPADAAAVAELPGWPGDREMTVVADSGVGVGDALAECDAVRIDARLATALARVREVLGS